MEKDAFEKKTGYKMRMKEGTSEKKEQRKNRKKGKEGKIKENALHLALISKSFINRFKGMDFRIPPSPRSRPSKVQFVHRHSSKI